MSEKKFTAQEDRIAALLNKAESTTPEEAEALREHAYRLMEKYMIDQAVIDARRAKEGKEREPIVTRIITFTGAYQRSLMEMGTAVVYAMGTMRPLQSSGRQRVENHNKGRATVPTTSLHIVGFESDVTQAEVLIRSLEVQALLALKAWWSEAKDSYWLHSDSEKGRARQVFVVSFGQGAGARIRENKNQVIEEMSSGTDLVLVDRKSLVDEWIDENMTLGTARSRSRKWDGRASGAGNSAGRQANTGERSMTMGRGLPAGRS